MRVSYRVKFSTGDSQLAYATMRVLERHEFTRVYARDPDDLEWRVIRTAEAWAFEWVEVFEEEDRDEVVQLISELHANGLTHAKVAEAVGVHANTVQRILAARRRKKRSAA